MALRVLRYILEFYELLLKEPKYKKRKLPPVFPLVLYNGEGKWTSPENLKDLIDGGDLASYIPDFSYFRISENEFSKRALLRLNNIVSALFLIENLGADEIEKHFDDLNKTVSQETDLEAIRLFSKWLAYQLKHERVGEDLIEEIDKARSKKEVSNMFAKTAEKLIDKWFSQGVEKGIGQGIEQGIEQGLEKGIRKGNLDSLIRLLKKKFGRKITRDIILKISKLNLGQIEELIEKIFEIEDIKALKEFL